MKQLKKLAYYVSSHGLGHMVRSCDLMKTLLERYPELIINISSALPKSFFEARLDEDRFIYRFKAHDVGLVQEDPLTIDFEESLDRAEAMVNNHEGMIKAEQEYLTDEDIQIVIADIPAVPLQAAARMRVPSFAVSNFSWDYIYEEYIARDTRWERVVDYFRKAYSEADLLFKLPFSPELKVFKKSIDVPLLARPGKNMRELLSAKLQVNEEKPWILLAFQSLNISEEALSEIEKLQEYEFFTVSPLSIRRSNIHTIPKNFTFFSNIVASIDAVISKPGFGIVSDCIVNEKALIFVNREDFREYTYLKRGIEKNLQSVEISKDALYKGNISEAIELIWKIDQPIIQNNTDEGRLISQEIFKFL